ncbi:hypothetical protein L2E82_37650 [Cichorium intybus]|uniref:Uncharacterized protein n=1 Tax=Cichorium intybus TaxID=13427 RepID=A0ACB9AFQ2_CICIN|nr:hypothetical protein L2E82_37650 [Cichorium intybus]
METFHLSWFAESPGGPSRGGLAFQYPLLLCESHFVVLWYLAIHDSLLILGYDLDPKNSKRNRGFAFIEYYNHACAEYSRQKMLNPKFKLDDNAPTMSWADPKNAESLASSQVKAVYVKNLPKNIVEILPSTLFFSSYESCLHEEYQISTIRLNDVDSCSFTWEDQS